MPEATLIVFSGLPGAGKTTLSTALARDMAALYLRIDTIECALRAGLEPGQDVAELGYRAAYAIAEDNLRFGRSVVADSVNPLAITRRAWHEVARRAAAEVADIEVVCSDIAEHRHRVETRVADIPGLKLPTWADVVEREYHPWSTPRIVIDTAGRSTSHVLSELKSALGERAARA